MKKLFSSIEKIGHKRTLESGEILFFEGMKANNLLLLLSGKVRLYKSQENLSCKEHTLHILNAPQFIAEMPFFMQTTYPANAECIQTCEIIGINFETFQNQCLQNNQICLLFINSLCKKIQILESHISTYNQSLQMRVLQYLQTHKANLPTLTQRKIAQSLNITPESLSRTLKILKEKHIIATHKGKIVFLDSNA